MNAPEPTSDDFPVGHVYDMLVVSNRLPVDYEAGPDGETQWRSSPGGLVTALEPVMRATDGAWVGWAGQPDIELAAFDHEGIRIVPVPLSPDDLEMYYEGFSNDTLWPLYHDVIAQPGYHRVWWDSYYEVNQRFADAVVANPDEVAEWVWVDPEELSAAVSAAPYAFSPWVALQLAELSR